MRVHSESPGLQANTSLPLFSSVVQTVVYTWGTNSHCRCHATRALFAYIFFPQLSHPLNSQLFILLLLLLLLIVLQLCHFILQPSCGYPSTDQETKERRAKNSFSGGISKAHSFFQIWEEDLYFGQELSVSSTYRGRKRECNLCVVTIRSLEQLQDLFQVWEYFTVNSFAFDTQYVLLYFYYLYLIMGMLSSRVHARLKEISGRFCPSAEKEADLA